MYFLSCLVLHLRCCFPLEALCVVGRQAFPPLSYILYPRFLAALADQSPKSSSSIWDAQFQRTQSGLPNQGTQKKALWVCFSSCFIFHYGICFLPAPTIYCSNTYANIFNGITMLTSSVPMEAVYQLLSRHPRVCQEAKGTWKVLHRKKLERLLRYTEHLETKDFMQANKSCLLCDLGSSYFCTLIHMPCHSVDQVGLEPRPPLASHKLAFKARTSMKRYY